MLCCVCKKNRAAKIHEREADGRVIREYYCADCFARLFPDFSSAFTPKVSRKEAENTESTANTANHDAERTEKKERRCPFCGTGAREYYQTKLVGCAECYRYLFDEIKESIFAMQGDEPHAGKRPAGAEIAKEEEQPRGGNLSGGNLIGRRLRGEEEQLTIFGAAEEMNRSGRAKERVR